MNSKSRPLLSSTRFHTLDPDTYLMGISLLFLKDCDSEGKIVKKLSKKR